MKLLQLLQILMQLNRHTIIFMDDCHCLREATYQHPGQCTLANGIKNSTHAPQIEITHLLYFFPFFQHLQVKIFQNLLKVLFECLKRKCGIDLKMFNLRILFSFLFTSILFPEILVYLKYILVLCLLFFFTISQAVLQLFQYQFNYLSVFKYDRFMETMLVINSN